MNFSYSKLRGKMRECGYTQAQLAETIGIDCSTLSAKLNNKAVFTKKEIVLICELLKITNDELASYFFAE